MKTSLHQHKSPLDTDEGVGAGCHDLLADMRAASRSRNALEEQLLSMGITENGDGVTDDKLLGGVL